MSEDSWMWLGTIGLLLVWLFFLRKAFDWDEEREEQRKKKDREFWEEGWDEIDD